MLDHCLSSLAGQSCREFAVTVVDNGSADHSLQLLREKYPWVKTILFQENQGFCKAVNAGIAASSADWIFLLNNDIEMEKDCIAQLYQGIASYPEIDFFAIKMLGFTERDVVDGAGDEVFRGGVGYRLGTLEKDGEIYSRDRDCFGACAGAALYRATLFSAIGVFDERFFAYLEDVDFNFRAQRAGKKCRFLHRAKIYHIGSATTGSKINPTTVRLSTRNAFWVMRKNYSFYLFLRFLPAILIFQFMWLCYCTKHRKLGSYLRGVMEALSGLGQFESHGVDRVNSLQIEDRLYARAIIDSEKVALGSIMARRKAAGKGNLLLRCYRRLFFLGNGR